MLKRQTNTQLIYCKSMNYNLFSKHYLKFLYFQHAIAINVTVLRMRREKNLLLKPWYLLFVVSVPHELVSTKWYRLPRVEYQPHLRNASITCCVWVYFFCFIIFIISEVSCLLCLQVFAFAVLQYD